MIQYKTKVTNKDKGVIRVEYEDGSIFVIGRDAAGRVWAGTASDAEAELEFLDLTKAENVQRVKEIASLPDKHPLVSLANEVFGTGSGEGTDL